MNREVLLYNPEEPSFEIEISPGEWFIFCEKSLEKFKEFEAVEIAFINDGYLCRLKNNKIQYFHRWLMDKEILDFAWQKNLIPYQVVVHHVNGNKNDNRIKNLQVMTSSAHYEHHSMENAFKTWCEKVYGNIDYERWQEFCDWKNSKEENY